MKKKTLLSVMALMLSLVMVAGLSACGKKAEEQPKDEPEQEQQEEQQTSAGPELTEDEINSLMWQISDQEVDIRYQEYMPDEGFAKAEIFGIERDGNEGTAYVYLAQGEYAVVDDKAYNIAGAAGEAIIRFEYTDEEPRYRKTVWSADGGEHDQWLKDNFPEDCLKKDEAFLSEIQEGKNPLWNAIDEDVEKEMGVPVEQENMLEIDEEKGTYKIVKTTESGDPADDSYKFDSEVVKEGKLKDLNK